MSVSSTKGRRPWTFKQLKAATVERISMEITFRFSCFGPSDRCVHNTPGPPIKPLNLLLPAKLSRYEEYCNTSLVRLWKLEAWDLLFKSYRQRVLDIRHFSGVKQIKLQKCWKRQKRPNREEKTPSTKKTVAEASRPVLPHGNIIKESERSEKFKVPVVVFPVLTPYNTHTHTHTHSHPCAHTHSHTHTDI